MIDTTKLKPLKHKYIYICKLSQISLTLFCLVTSSLTSSYRYRPFFLLSKRYYGCLHYGESQFLHPSHLHSSEHFTPIW